MTYYWRSISEKKVYCRIDRTWTAIEFRTLIPSYFRPTVWIYLHFSVDVFTPILIQCFYSHSYCIIQWITKPKKWLTCATGMNLILIYNYLNYPVVDILDYIWSILVNVRVSCEDCIDWAIKIFAKSTYSSQDWSISVNSTNRGIFQIITNKPKDFSIEQSKITTKYSECIF